MHICVERKMGLIHKKAIYRSVFSVCYCKHLITRGDWASFLWTSILFLYLNAQSLVHTERHLWRRAQLEISVAAWRWFCSSLPLSLFPFTPPLHWLNQHTGPPGVTLQLCTLSMYQWQKLVSPSDRARRGTVNRKWLWNGNGGTSERMINKKNLCLTENWREKVTMNQK